MIFYLFGDGILLHDGILLQSENISGTRWQHATIEITHATITLRVCYSFRSIIHMLVLAKITHHDQFITASSHHTYVDVILHAH